MKGSAEVNERRCKGQRKAVQRSRTINKRQSKVKERQCKGVTGEENLPTPP